MSIVPDGAGGGGGLGGQGPFCVPTPNPANFHNVAINHAAIITFTIRRTGGSQTGDISFSTPVVAGHAAFTLLTPPAVLDLSYGQTTTFVVQCLDANVDGAITGTVTIQCDQDGDHVIPLSANVVGAIPLLINPAVISEWGLPQSPQSKVGQLNGVASGVTVTNVSGVTVHITGEDLTLAPDFFSSPLLNVFPVTILNNQSWLYFTQPFPQQLGYLSESIALHNDAGAGDLIIPVVVVSVPLIPQSVLSNQMRRIFMGFEVGVSPQSYFFDSTTFNGQLNGTLVFNGALWSNPGTEKTLLRLQLYYRNRGVCQLGFIAKVFRPNQPSLIPGADNYEFVNGTVLIGTSSADGEEMSSFVDLIATGDLIILTMTRAAAAGDCEIEAIIPHFADRGEKVESQ